MVAEPSQPDWHPPVVVATRRDIYNQGYDIRRSAPGELTKVRVGG